MIPVTVVALLKSRRKGRRRGVGPGHTRAAGAWDELLDTYAELGYIVNRRMTRVDMALNLEDQFRREVAARHGEREAARLRAGEREEARAKNRASAQSEAQTPNPLGGFLDATILRARHATAWRPGVADAELRFRPSRASGMSPLTWTPPSFRAGTSSRTGSTRFGKVLTRGSRRPAFPSPGSGGS